jgi:hypothetical protein
MPAQPQGFSTPAAGTVGGQTITVQVPSIAAAIAEKLVLEQLPYVFTSSPHPRGTEISSLVPLVWPVVNNQCTIHSNQAAVASRIFCEIEKLKELTDPEKRAQQAVVAAAQVEAVLQQVKQHASVANSQVELTITQLKASAKAAEAERALAAAVAVTEVQATLKQVESAVEVAAATKPLLDKLDAIMQKQSKMEEKLANMEEKLQANCSCNCVVM